MLERAAESRKTINREILGPTRRNGNGLATIKAQLDRVGTKLDAIEHTVDGFAAMLQALIRDLPAIASNAAHKAQR